MQGARDAIVLGIFAPAERRRALLRTWDEIVTLAFRELVTPPIRLADHRTASFVCDQFRERLASHFEVGEAIPVFTREQDTCGRYPKL